MSARPPRSLRFGAIFLLFGGVLQAVGLALAVVASVILLLNPGGEPPGIAIVAVVWLPVAAVLTIAVILSRRALRHARANQARLAGRSGLVAGMLCLAIFMVAVARVGPPWIALVLLLTLAAASIVGALFCFSAARVGSRGPPSDEQRPA